MRVKRIWVAAAVVLAMSLVFVDTFRQGSLVKQAWAASRSLQNRTEITESTAESLLIVDQHGAGDVQEWQISGAAVWTLDDSGNLVPAGAQTVDGKKIVGGHGHAMPNTYLLRKYIDEIKRVPFNGVIVHVNRNDFAGKEKLRELRPIRWFREPAVSFLMT